MLTNVKRITINATSDPNTKIGTLYTCSEYRWINVLNDEVITSMDKESDTIEFVVRVAEKHKSYEKPSDDELKFLQSKL